MTLTEARANLSRMQELTGKWANAYTCGPKTYDALLRHCGVEDPAKVDKVKFMGVDLFPSGHTPEGKFYPCSYIEGMVG